MKVYELIKLTVDDGDKNVETSLYTNPADLDKAFSKMVKKELKSLKENYGEDGIVECDSDDIQAIEAASVVYGLNEKAHTFYANDEMDPGEHEINIWVVEHKI